MRNLAGADEANLISRDCNNGSGLSGEGDKFHFIGSTFGVNMNHSTDIAWLKTVLSQRLAKDNSVMFPNHGLTIMDAP